MLINATFFIQRPPLTIKSRSEVMATGLVFRRKTLGKLGFCVKRNGKVSGPRLPLSVPKKREVRKISVTTSRGPITSSLSKIIPIALYSNAKQ